jgi:hypothetical protein
MVTRRQILGDVVTAFEVTPGISHLQPAEVDGETVSYLYKQLLKESDKLANSIKPQAEISSVTSERSTSPQS